MSRGADEEFPTPDPGREPNRLLLRAVCTVVLAAALAAWNYEFLLRLRPLLWPPTDPLSRWVGFVLLQAGAYLLLPAVVGSFAADRLYARYVADESD
ncbi:hypothetical protein [Halopelagius longus]|uniref:Uncharacterized protein n=1 Tax=Halopelagius longus TaxID=1236180 RepID=A0A1H1C382_9EURY|nr:hypothetical protein [Halopelagius longus]RDI71045.1 hypothetical protein DWB78_04480 [Halopelagius longus]SDQ58595.1 hypothetical protein SAMN05216278_2087 [Halopelagius longus]